MTKAYLPHWNNNTRDPKSIEKEKILNFFAQKLLLLEFLTCIKIKYYVLILITYNIL